MYYLRHRIKLDLWRFASSVGKKLGLELHVKSRRLGEVTSEAISDKMPETTVRTFCEETIGPTR